MGSWSIQRYPLNTQRVFAGGASSGRYIYVGGGSDGTNDLASVERARILSPAEAPVIAPNDPDTTYIYVGGGQNLAGGFVNNMDRARIQPGGELDAFAFAGKNLTGGWAGYGVLAAAGQLFIFGGDQAMPSTKGISGQITSGAGLLANNSWNAGLSLLTPRAFMGRSVLTIFPFVTYRYTGLGKLVPYVGVGPRISLLEGVTYGMVGQTALLANKERSTSVGVGAPLGADYAIGPGAALAELLFAWNAVDHTSTGDSSLTSFTLWVGYRLML
jgi:hypothetical protein